MNRFLFFISFIAIYSRVNEACEKNEIVIINDLGPGRILQYHCRYPKKDFGVQYLNFDAIKTIQLRDEGFNITKWHCLLKHGLNMRYHKDILVYSQNTRAPQCGQVRVWTARLGMIWFKASYDVPSGRSLYWDY
ncbi:Plant self-incompatibility S1 [Arabidopsis thaliana x Arabidopsis arenosa]|uniref:Plant self-incompatibility S1 n=2 Tax=Arabidopsis TaxID=3701 RepID=A0A8T1YPN7_ARASU|nr:Plant self-incompatibility S1 [Arabidopsis thaliana x Arabidopsis arenosa]KAG7547825.1 Plant self-incompatibility S1 [Arabidopsis suecica]